MGSWVINWCQGNFWCFSASLLSAWWTLESITIHVNFSKQTTRGVTLSINETPFEKRSCRKSEKSMGENSEPEWWRNYKFTMRIWFRRNGSWWSWMWSSPRVWVSDVERSSNKRAVGGLIRDMLLWAKPTQSFPRLLLFNKRIILMKFRAFRCFSKHCYNQLGRSFSAKPQEELCRLFTVVSQFST